MGGSNDHWGATAERSRTNRLQTYFEMGSALTYVDEEDCTTTTWRYEKKKERDGAVPRDGLPLRLPNPVNYCKEVPLMATNSGILAKSTTPTFSDSSANANRLASPLLCHSISNTPAKFPPLYDHTLVMLWEGRSTCQLPFTDDPMGLDWSHLHIVHMDVTVRPTCS